MNLLDTMMACAIIGWKKDNKWAHATDGQLQNLVLELAVYSNM